MPAPKISVFSCQHLALLLDRFSSLPRAIISLFLLAHHPKFFLLPPDLRGICLTNSLRSLRCVTPTPNELGLLFETTVSLRTVPFLRHVRISFLKVGLPACSALTNLNSGPSLVYNLFVNVSQRNRISHNP